MSQSPAKETTFICNACTKSYSTNGNLHRHWKSNPICKLWLERDLTETSGEKLIILVD